MIFTEDIAIKILCILSGFILGCFLSNKNHEDIKRKYTMTAIIRIKDVKELKTTY